MRKNIKFQKSKSKNISWIGLVAIALVLIVVIYNQQQRQQVTIPSPSPIPETIPETLTDEEKFILNPRAAESSRSALKKHAQMVAELAKQSQELELQKDCRPNPLVIQVKQGSEIKISNNDSVPRRIIIDSKHFYDIPKGGSKEILAQFKYGTGDYGYVCQGVGIVGFLHVV